MLKRLLLLSAVVFVLVCCGVGTRCFASTIEKADGHREEREYHQAEAIYKQIISESNDADHTLRAQEKLTILYIETNDRTKADAAFGELVTKYADHARIAKTVYYVADEYGDAKKYDKARESYQYVADHWPQADCAIEAQVAVVRSSILLEDDAGAQAATDALLAKFSASKDLPKAVDHAADAHRHAGKYKEARELYRYIVQKWPEADHAMESQRGVVLSSIRMGDDANAASELEKLISDFAENEGVAGAVCGVADEYRESGKYNEALANYDYVVETWPETEDAMEAQSGVVLTNVLLKDDSAANAALNVLISKYSKSEDVEEIVKEIAAEYRELDKNADAIEVYKKVVENWPESDEAVESQAEVVKLYASASDDANTQAAIDKLVTGFTKEGKVVEAIEEAAEECSEAREYGSAIELCKRMVERWPDDDLAIEAQTNVVRLYISIGDEPNASTAFEKLMGKFAGNERIARAVWEVADGYWEDGAAEKAYEKYKYVVGHWPESERAIWAKMGMVRSRVRQSDLERAEAELGELLTEFAGHEDLAAAVHEIVEEYRNTGAYEEGRGLFAYLLENWDGSDGTALELQVGIVLQSIKLGEPNKAEATIAKLIADYSDHPNIGKALFQIAEEYFYAENYPKAIELWELIESDFSESSFPNKNEIPFMLGTCYERLKNFDMAIENYTKAIERYPSARFTPRVPYRIGLIYMGYKQDYEKATHWFRQQYQRFDDEMSGSRALRHEGFIYLKTLGDYESAKACFENYLRLYPAGENIWEATYGLALCYEKEGNNEQATRLFNEALTKASNQRQREVIEAHLSN